MTTLNSITLPKAEIVGPYSKWPRKPGKARLNLAVTAISVTGAAAFFHCVVPFIVA